jgi:AraC-like DNA-binding protein
MDNRPVMLWVDLTGSKREPELPRDAEEHWSVHVIHDPAQIGAAVERLTPNVLCFEFDYPNDAGLAALTRTKADYPRIPILMITVYHSEALAVWALRARVWDYMVRPFSAEDMLRSAEALARVGREQEQDRRLRPRQVILPMHDFAYMHNLKGAEKTILKAQSYILQNLSESLQLSDVAQHCYVSRTHLSRIFREAGGTTFKEFVLQTRIRRAVELLTDTDQTITGICYDVGFRDVSHFGRVFRRYVGMSPSVYRQVLLSNKRAAPEWRPTPPETN